MYWEVERLVSAFNGITYFWARGGPPLHQRPTDDVAFDHQLTPLVGAVLLPWALRMANDPNPDRFAHACSMAGVSCDSAFEYWQKLCAGVLALRAPQQTRGLVLQGDAPPLLPAQLVQDTIPVLVRLATRLQQHITQPATAPPAGSSGSQTAVPGQVPAPSPNQRRAYGHVVMLLTTMTRNAQQSAGPPQAGAAAELLPVLFKRLREVLACFESAVRMAGSAQPAQLLASLDSPGVAEWVLEEISVLLNDSSVGSLLVEAAGQSSSRQRQLHSLLFSMLKFAGVLLAHKQHAPTAAQRLRAMYLTAVSNTCMKLLLAAAAADEQQQAADLRAAASPAHMTYTRDQGDAADAGAGAGAAAAGEPEEQSATATAADRVRSALPAVVLAGRLCLLWSQGLLSELPVLTSSHNPLQVLGPYSITYNYLLAGQPSTPSSSFLQAFLQRCIACLTVTSNVEQLSAWGYDPAHFAQLAQQAVPSRDVAQGRCMDAATLEDLAHNLQSVGRALCSLAVPVACNNPGCSTFSGATELISVSGVQCVCSGCKTARYCCKVCQKAHWKAAHKPVCQALAAAAAATAATAAAATASVSADDEPAV